MGTPLAHSGQTLRAIFVLVGEVGKQLSLEALIIDKGSLNQIHRSRFSDFRESKLSEGG